MILISYAHEPEIKRLKQLIFAHDNPSISWSRWRSGQPLPEFQKEVALLLNVGFAGSLDDMLKPGDTVLAKEVVLGDTAGPCSLLKCDHFQIARSFARSHNLNEIRLLTSAMPVLSEEYRLSTQISSGAHAVDMEAGYLLQAANQNGIPFLSFKIISDKADSNAWFNIKNNIDIYSRKLGETVFEFLKQGPWI